MIPKMNEKIHPHTRQSHRLLLRWGCLTVKTTKTEPRKEIHNKNTMRKKGSRMATNMQISTIWKKLRPTVKMFKINTCNKHITACNEKREKSPKHFFKTIGWSIHQAPPRSTLVQNGHKHANFHYKEKAKAHCKDVQDKHLQKTHYSL